MSKLLVTVVAPLLVGIGIAGCDPFEEERKEQAEKSRVECLDKICEGDVEPKRDMATEVAFKLNGEWYIGPKVYGNPNFGAIAFYWPSKAAGNDADAIAHATEVLKAKVGTVKNFYDVAIEIFPRSNNIPPEPRGYKFIQLAETKDWIESRTTVRPGLDAIKMKPGVGPQANTLGRATYYVATQRNGLDGLPPVATCDQSHVEHAGSTGFMWRPGIWVGVRMNQKHCTDWPAIHDEILRVLQLLRKAQQ